MRALKPAFSPLGLTLLALSTIAGCGGSGNNSSSPSTATLRMTVAWPSHTYRAVPNTSKSIVATVKVKGKEIARALFVRGGIEPRLGRSPSPIEDGSSVTIDFPRLPEGEATVTMVAYPSKDGTGTAQATGQATETLRRGEVKTETVAMESTVKTLTLGTGAARFKKDSGADLMVLGLTARDASGAIVLVDGDRWRESLEWTSSVSETATVGSSGYLYAAAAGETTIGVSMAVNDAGDRVSASLPVTVAELRSLAITPAGAAVMDPSDIQLTVTGTYSDGLTEDMTPSVAYLFAGDGTISPTGLLQWNPGFTSSVSVTARFGTVDSTRVTFAIYRP